MKSLNTQELYTPAIYQCALNLPCWLTFCWAPFLEGYEAKIPEERAQQAQQPEHKVGGDRDLLRAKLAVFRVELPHRRVQPALEPVQTRRVVMGVHSQIARPCGDGRSPPTTEVWCCSNPLCLRKSHFKFLESKKRGHFAEKTETICYLATHANSIATFV